MPRRKIFFESQVISILVIDDYTLLYDNDVVIKIVFVWFDLAKVDNAYCRDYSDYLTSKQIFAPLKQI